MIVAEQSVLPAWQAQVSNWLVQSGCLYMMAWGVECSRWDDAVDTANMAAFKFGEIPDDRFVLTTWHEKQSMRDVFWFAKHAARHPAVQLKHTMLVHIAATANSAGLMRSYGEA